MGLTSWVVIIGLIGINAVYVAAEFAAVSARRTVIQQYAEGGNRLASRLLPVLSDSRALDRYIATSQIGITLSSLVLGAYGQATLAIDLAPVFERFGQMQQVAAHSAAAVVVLIGLTVLQMVLGELVPKSIALQYPTRTALWTVVPMQWSIKLLAWFIAVLNGSGVALLRVLRVRERGHRHIHSPEEIELLVAESRDGGLLEPDEQHRVQEALRLGIRPVRTLMVPRVDIEALDVDCTIDELVRAASYSQFSRLPVYERSIDSIVGVIHARDVVARAVASPGAISCRSVMRRALVVPHSMTADRLLLRMREERQHLAVVADEFGGTAGLITAGDICAELIGDVGDEFKPASIEAEQLADGRVRLMGTMRLDRAAELVGAEWDRGASTVAGHLLKVLGRVPRIGEQLVIDGVQVEVETVERHAIRTVVATPILLASEGRHG
jgi:putative hemolysin